MTRVPPGDRIELLPDPAALAAADEWLNQVATRRPPPHDPLAARLVAALDAIDAELPVALPVPRPRRSRPSGVLPVLLGASVVALVAVGTTVLTRSSEPDPTIRPTPQVLATAVTTAPDPIGPLLDQVDTILRRGGSQGYLDAADRDAANSLLRSARTALAVASPSDRRDELADRLKTLQARLAAVPGRTAPTVPAAVSTQIPRADSTTRFTSGRSIDATDDATGGTGQTGDQSSGQSSGQSVGQSGPNSQDGSDNGDSGGGSANGGGSSN